MPYHHRVASGLADLYIFDLDGTILDSAVDICAAVARAVAEHDSDAARAIGPETLRPWVGRPLRDIFAAVAPGADPALLATRYRQIYSGCCVDTTRGYPGVVETLQTLARRGARLAIATTKKTWMASLVLEKMGLTAHFDLVQGTDDFPGKPDPAILQRVLAHFDLPPERALMVGDTIADILCARAAGVPSAAALYGFGPSDELRALAPQYLLNEFSDLLDVAQAFLPVRLLDK